MTNKELQELEAILKDDEISISISYKWIPNIKDFIKKAIEQAKQQGSLENTHDMIELLEAYVLCPEEELTEDAIKTIREPIIKVLRTKWNMEVTKVSDSVGKEYVVYSYQDNPKDRKEK